MPAPLLRLCAAGALALWVGCASAPAPPPPPLEVLRTTSEDGTVRYTLRRNRPADSAATDPDGASSPPGDEAPSGAGEEENGPGEQIRAQVENDREFLRTMISRNAPAGFERSQDPRLREIAERLPRLQAELEALENEPQP